ncbi:MAG: DNA-directed DNA polymerase [Methanobrevibacter sp.]|jgi:DNA polymerase I|nr:DNA-directed DNA polymerase [Methanobrevibacter sp.]
MERRNFVLFDIDYITINEKPVIRLFGKSKSCDSDNSNNSNNNSNKNNNSNNNNNNNNFYERNLIAIDDSFEPYIYVISHNIDQARNEILDIGSYKIKDFEILRKKIFQVETEVLKVIFIHPRHVSGLRDEIRSLDSVDGIREHDIPFYRRYLINNNIFPMSLLEINGEVLNSFETINSDAEIFKLNEPPKSLNKNISDFRILCFDLEVYNPHGMPNSEKDEIIMIGVSSNTGINKVISTKGEDLDFVDTVDSEEEMINRFISIVKEENVDIIVGYNSDNFDFPYLKDRAKIYNIKLDLGMDGSHLNFIKRGYGNAGSFKGLIHIDLYLLMRRYISLDRYTLERVYLELFGEEKIDVAGDKIWQFWDSDGEDLVKLFNYSLDDVVSTLKIAELTLPLSLELTKIVGQPFFDISRMATGQQAEWYLVRKAFEDNEIVPNKPVPLNSSRRNKEQNVGGYVKEPEKGLHENLVQFDFRSLYPSIIISKNISPDVILKKNAYTGEYIENIVSKNLEQYDNDECFNISPEKGYKFAKEPVGFIPSVIGNVLDERLKLKNAMKKTENQQEKKSLDVQQQALKRLANTMYGIYGFLRFRWYSNECAESITAWGREFIQNTMKKAEAYGFKAIYADTDGFYAEYNENLIKNISNEDKNIENKKLEKDK